MGSATDQQTRRTQAERREEAEGKMLQAALMLVAEKGLAGVKLNDVGEVAGYSRGLPAHYFGRRDVLIAKLTRFIMDEYTNRLANSPEMQGKVGLEMVIDSADFYLASVERDPTNMCALLVLLNEAKNYDQLREEIKELNRRSVRRFARSIRDGQDRGEIDQGIDAVSQSVLLLAQLRGASSLWLLDQEKISMKNIRESLKQSLRRSLAV